MASSQPKKSKRSARTAMGNKRRLRRYLPFDLTSVASVKSTPTIDSPLDPHGGSPQNQQIFPTSIQVDRNAVLDFVFAHVQYKPPGQENNPLSDLPEFDSVAQYCDNADQATKLASFVEREADRLIHAAKHPNDALLFDGSKLNQRPSNASYQAVSDAAEVLHVGVIITSIDNNLVIFQHLSESFDPGMQEKLQNTLQKELDDDPGYFKNVDVELCWALVNFVTAFLARLITQAFDSEFLRQRSLAVLARLSTKLKVLCMKPKANVKTCLDEGLEVVSAEDLRRLLVGAQPAGHEVSDENLVDGKSHQESTAPGPRARNETLQRLFSDRNKRKGLYFAEMQLFRERVFHIAMLLFGNLEEGSKASGLPVDCFEIASLVYRTGFDQFPVLLGQDRDGEILASSTSDVLRISHTAFLLLGQSMKKISDPARRPINGDNQGDRVATSVYWEWEDENTDFKDAFPDGIPVELESMTEVVSTMIPLLCTQPPTSRLLMGLLIMASNLNRSEALLESLPREKFAALVYMKTSNFDERHARFAGDDAKSLSQSLMTQGYLSNLGANLQFSREAWRQRNHQEREETVRNIEQKFKRLAANIEGDNGTIDERAIIIQCPLYVMFWEAVCLVLVLGGLAIGFSVQQRIEGVDPFNITSFCWILAAFILLVVKSVRVENWPWRDFLKRRVVCRSVSELCSVTGLNPQSVLAYLLHNEASTILITRGPFNKPFFRRDNDGFSIDVRPELHTLLFSGVVFLKVSTNRGLGLVCLNVRKGTDYVPFTHSHQVDEEEWNLACLNYPKKVEESDATLNFVHLGWNRILGIYDVADRKFR